MLKTSIQIVLVGLRETIALIHLTQTSLAQLSTLPGEVKLQKQFTGND